LPDILHVHWLVPYCVWPKFRYTRLVAPLLSVLMSGLFFFQLLVLRLAGPRLVWTVHNLTDHENQSPRIDRWSRRLVARMATAMIVHCEGARGIVTKTLGPRCADKISVVYHSNFMDLYENAVSRDQARQTLGLPDAATVLLFLGGVRPYKGLPELISAFGRLDAPDVHLVIAGKAFNPAWSKEIANRCAGHPRIVYHDGFVPAERVQEYMNACDAVIFPYTAILTSGAVLLAMSFGRACVAPRLGCVADVLDNQGAVLYDKDAPDGLLDALRGTIARTAELPQMGQHNHSRVAQWTWAGMAEQTEAVYRGCVRR
jgi:glycosyltransferase involved in cell wall biosynthesis